MENVPAVRKEALHIIATDLAALGYRFWWDGISAGGLGAPHLRERFFLLAYADGQRSAERERERETLGGGKVVAGDGKDGEVADAHGARQANSQRGRATAGSCRGSEPGSDVGRRDQSALGRIIHGLPARPYGSPWLEGWEESIPRVKAKVPRRVQRISALGNAVIPQVAEILGRLIIECEKRRHP